MVRVHGRVRSIYLANQGYLTLKTGCQMNSSPKPFVLAKLGISSSLRLIEDNSEKTVKLILEEMSGEDALGVTQWKLICYSYPWAGGGFHCDRVSSSIATALLLKIRELTYQLEAVNDQAREAARATERDKT